MVEFEAGLDDDLTWFGKPKGIVPRLAVYADDIKILRQRGYSWGEIAALVALADPSLSKSISKGSVISLYYERAVKRLTAGVLVVQQQRLFTENIKVD